MSPFSLACRQFGWRAAVVAAKSGNKSVSVLDKTDHGVRANPEGARTILGTGRRGG
ncbi:hypothetical protein [Alloactinosynnema sp. L-07]|nr:hypothetical protein [Alloactinosynnema sp. L-07]